jgi:transcriptional activator
MIEGQTDGYRLRVEAAAVDAMRFERLVIAGQARTEDGSRRARLLREALELWRGDAMQDVGLLDSAAFGAAVSRLEELRLTAAEERADALGVDPSPELAALHVALLRGELGRRQESRKTNLRAELTAFVGRDAAVAAVRELIATRRLTTLIGPGGSGKTRLATETARTLLGDLPDGAWLVELAAIPAPAFSNVVRTFTVVVLPAPFGPSMEKTDPAVTSKSIPSRTTLSP